MSHQPHRGFQQRFNQHLGNYVLNEACPDSVLVFRVGLLGPCGQRWEAAVGGLLPTLVMTLAVGPCLAALLAPGILNCLQSQSRVGPPCRSRAKCWTADGGGSQGLLWLGLLQFYMPRVLVGRFGLGVAVVVPPPL